MGNRKLLPLRPTTTQTKRVARELPGDGFFIYNMGERKVPNPLADIPQVIEVVEFRVDQETGVICDQAGKPLRYEVNGEEMTVVSSKDLEALREAVKHAN